ncbi:raffinose/stachyose/melibiose transport system substrate-binding protein [Virgibacillus halotolerans]|uniref:ABC transporter substrate-binding protein n=1 Tax=Virgibacillus halotolerans TaxID=1071053 RepID=UPI001961E174|nr:ABC transporter substrate-binding protein [Virgibacillus halotolerans]MBM7600044.1 raffinose/stachyose/melibiose transport system substrate-binding protein [Virgibacillus halotolerans]
MKKNYMLLITLSILTLLVAGCSDNTSSDDNRTSLVYYSTATTEDEKASMKNVVAKFEAENPDIEIKENYPAGEYESMLRVKMAANDMPDLFDTHGWAKERYGEYVEDLSDMGWVENLDPALEPVLKDDDGKVYAYPLNQAKDGLAYNENLLNEYGIEPPETFDAFMKALETVKEKSGGEVTPLWFPGSKKSSLAQFFDQFATPLLITDADHDYEEALLDGTLDWSNYTYLPKKMKEMQDKGLLNIDILTAQQYEMNDLIAQNKIAFIVGGSGQLGPMIEELNPDIQIGIQPMPAIHKGDKQIWIGGERHTVAMWKDSQHKEEAKKFIEFLTQPEIAKEVAEGTRLPAGLTNVKANNYYQDYFEKYADIKVEPYFDRVYLPSGMWDVMGTTSQELLSDQLTPEEVSKTMAEEYIRLRNQ